METTEIRTFIEVFRNGSGWEPCLRRKPSGPTCGHGDVFSRLLGTAGADDPAFLLLKNEGAVGPQFLLPREWLRGSFRGVFFLPFTARVREATESPAPNPPRNGSMVGLRGRISSTAFPGPRRTPPRGRSGRGLSRRRFAVRILHPEDTAFLDEAGTPFPVTFTSNWSERHVALSAASAPSASSRGSLPPWGSREVRQRDHHSPAGSRQLFG